MPINRKRDDRVLVCCSARSRSTALGESRFSTGFEATGHQTEIEEKPVQTEAFTSSHLHIHENERVIELLMYGFLSKVTEPNLPILFGVLLHFFNSSSLIIFFNDSSIARFVKKKKKILFPIKDSLLIDVNNVYLRTIFPLRLSNRDKRTESVSRLHWRHLYAVHDKPWRSLPLYTKCTMTI